MLLVQIRGGNAYQVVEMYIKLPAPSADGNAHQDVSGQCSISNRADM